MRGDGSDVCDGGDLTDMADPSCERRQVERIGSIPQFLDVLSGLHR